MTGCHQLQIRAGTLFRLRAGIRFGNNEKISLVGKDSLRLYQWRALVCVDKDGAGTSIRNADAVDNFADSIS